MTAVNVTTEALIASVRRRSMSAVTDDGVTFPKDSDIRDLLNEEISGWLVPFILKAREGHYLTYVDAPLVSGQTEYLIPQRAAGGDVSFVQIVDASGNPLLPAPHQEDPEVAAKFVPGSSYGAPYYFFRGNAVVLGASFTSGASLRIWFPQRPNQLVASSTVGVITAVSGSTITYSGTPTVNVGTRLECVHAQPGFEVVALGAVTAVGTGTVTFAGTIPIGVGIGDYLCPEDTAPVVTNTPADLTGLLCQWVAIKLIEYRGDDKQLERAENTFANSEKRALQFLGKRDQLAHRKIVPARNRRRWPPFSSR